MYTNLCGWDLDAQQKFTSITITRMLKVQVKEVIILSLPKITCNTTKYGLKSWRYFATKKWNDLTNYDMRTKFKVGTNEVNNKT